MGSSRRRQQGLRRVGRGRPVVGNSAKEPAARERRADGVARGFGAEKQAEVALGHGGRGGIGSSRSRATVASSWPGVGRHAAGSAGQGRERLRWRPQVVERPRRGELEPQHAETCALPLSPAPAAARSPRKARRDRGIHGASRARHRRGGRRRRDVVLVPEALRPGVGPTAGLVSQGDDQQSHMRVVSFARQQLSPGEWPPALRPAPASASRQLVGGPRSVHCLKSGKGFLEVAGHPERARMVERASPRLGVFLSRIRRMRGRPRRHRPFEPAAARAPGGLVRELAGRKRRGLASAAIADRMLRRAIASPRRTRPRRRTCCEGAAPAPNPPG